MQGKHLGKLSQVTKLLGLLPTWPTPCMVWSMVWWWSPEQFPRGVVLVTHTSCMQDMPASMLNYGLTEQFRKCMGSTGFQGLIFFSLCPISWDPEAEFRTLLSFSVFYKFNSYILGLCLHFIINCKCHVCVSVLLRWCAFGQLSCHAWNVMKTRGPDCSLLRSSQSTSHRSRGVNPDILVKFQQV